MSSMKATQRFAGTPPSDPSGSSLAKPRPRRAECLRNTRRSRPPSSASPQIADGGLRIAAGSGAGTDDGSGRAGAVERTACASPHGSVKLGFRTHYPQIETKLTMHGRRYGRDRAQIGAGGGRGAKAPRQFILAEDDQTLEGVVLAALAARGRSLAVVETFTAGQIAARIAHLPGAEKVFRRGLIARDPAELAAPSVSTAG